MRCKDTKILNIKHIILKKKLKKFLHIDYQCVTAHLTFYTENVKSLIFNIITHFY